jgi:hypothetical protein
MIPLVIARESPWRLARAPAGVCAAALAAVAAACAPAAQSPLDRHESDRTVTVQADTWRTDVTLRYRDHVAIADVPAPRREVWEHLTRAWEEVGLPEPVVDRSGYSLTVTNYAVTRRLGRTSMSNYLNCGSSLTGPIADTHRITLSVRTILEPASPDTTEVHTRVDAVATPTAGGSTASSVCSSRGVLEAQIASRVKYHLAASMLR